MSKIIVKSKSVSGFRRAGILFTREGVELDTKKLPKGALAAIQADAGLVIEGDIEESKSPAGEVALLGSDIAPSTVVLVDGTEAPLGDIVAIAFAGFSEVTKDSGADLVAAWNEMPQEEREECIKGALEAMQADPAIYKAFCDQREEVIKKAAKASKAKK